jgi:rhamnosyltransferase
VSATTSTSTITSATKMSDPRVSIILPTLNGERDLRRLLPMLARQEFAGGFEIRAIDSDSSDASRELLEQSGALVTRIPKSEFNHGPTRNRAARGARGEILVFLSQDALPRDEHFLAALVHAFDDERVAGAYARILPHEDDDALTKRTALDAPEASDVPESRDLDAIGSLTKLAAEERARFVVFNNVASAIRRSVFERIPFPDVAFGEDSAWCAAALEAGHRIRFVPASVVLHAHRYTLRTAYERYRIDAEFQRRVHGRRVRPNLSSVVRGIAHEVRRDVAFVSRHGRALQLLRSPALRTAQVLGQFRGSR